MVGTQKWGRLSTRITVVAAGAVFVGFAAMIGLIVKMSYERAHEAGYKQAKNLAEGYGHQVAGDINRAMELPKHLAQVLQGLRGAGSADRKLADALTLKLLDNSPQVVGLWTLWEPDAFDGRDDAYRLDWPKQDPTGRYNIYATKNKAGRATADVMMSKDRVAQFEAYRANPQSYQPDYEKPGWGDFYYTPKARNRDTITEPFPYEVQGKMLLESSLAVAIRDASGRFAGLAAADLSLEDLQKRLGVIRPYDTGFVQLVSAGGLYVVNPDASTLGKPVAKDGALAGHLDELKAGKPFVFQDGGFTHFFTPIAIGDTGQFWSLGVSVPDAAITAAAVEVRNSAIAIGIVALVAILAALFAVVRVLTRPLNRLAETMEGLASGQGDLTARIEVANRDEIGRTADAFNRFIASLHAMFADVREQSAAVSRAAAQLAASADEVRGASAQQSDAASATAAGVEQVTVSVQHIADTAGQAEQMARDTGKLSHESVRVVERVTADIGRINDTMHGLAGRMNGLGQRSEQVTGIVQVIKDIAEQTNLLALNASIEAARAGEQGRGFAVVADEVRNLAARTAEATVKISGIVTAIGQDTNEAVLEVQRTSRLMSDSVEVAREANGTMQHVRERTGDLVTRMVDIAASTREQSSASVEIAQNVERISGMAQANGETVAEVAAAVAELTRLSAKLERLVGNFRL
ncbi:methyl-accepting chemotaxis protein [Crenobacter cavernae]|uniref:Methyl-accepting chemotaxis protein n=1 Tax=Crenobacter cavernae TaxID=2290923 RepID=A0ABY0FBK4_9NEIS|nr:methyl-accepting chemotaxis protein [Crenobacter cavernae]RXZ43431.1 methyl-accepting chemotaxis protein [Crenobacter cavernae]